jgi:hypothetical protein
MHELKQALEAFYHAIRTLRSSYWSEEKKKFLYEYISKDPETPVDAAMIELLRNVLPGSVFKAERDISFIQWMEGKPFFGKKLPRYPRVNMQQQPAINPKLRYMNIPRVDSGSERTFGLDELWRVQFMVAQALPDNELVIVDNPDQFIFSLELDYFAVSILDGNQLNVYLYEESKDPAEIGLIEASKFKQSVSIVSFVVPKEQNLSYQFFARLAVLDMFTPHHQVDNIIAT